MLVSPELDPDVVMSTAKESEDIYLLGNRSVVSDLFLGQLMDAQKCRGCKATNVSFEPCFSMTLPLPTSALLSPSKVFSLRQCFKEF